VTAQEAPADTGPAFALRPGTNDDVVYDSVVTRNEYRLPDELAPDSLVVDIGVHIGAFSYLALRRGAGSVYGFEPEAANYARAIENLAPFGRRVHLSNRAVWRSDTPACQLHFWRSADTANTGGGSLIWETDGPLVDAVPFDAVIDAVSRGGRQRIDLVKIDCEGAEFPVLLTSSLLGRIDRIVGEYHELRARLPAHVRIPGYDEFALEGLVAGLQRAGFDVTWQHQATAKFGDMGLFFAQRPVAPRRAGPVAALRRWLGVPAPHR
jgi:FkbM family methyltransferase